MFFTNKKAVIDINDTYAKVNTGNFLKEYINSNINPTNKSIVFLCIGTDRSTGDSLGPIIGYKLSNFRCNNIVVAGSLEEPIHAKNIDEKVAEIKNLYENPFIVAIDACLGHNDSIGRINISKGPIYPGAGVNKTLLPVGDINITGIVNASGYMEYFVLQNTRLNLVMKMADVIAGGILCSIDELQRILHSLSGYNPISDELYLKI